MPKLTFDIKKQRLDPGNPENFTLVAPKGFIDSSSCRFFERALESASKNNTRFGVLDLSEVHYINSTGISMIIRHFGLYKERQGLFVLTSVPKSVGLSMHLLGVTSLIPFHKDQSAAVTQFKDFLEGKFKYFETAVSDTAVSETTEKFDQVHLPSKSRKKIYVPVRKGKSPLLYAKILLLIPKPGRFTRILKLRFNHLNGNFKIFHNANQALSAIPDMKPDLVVVDDRMDRMGEFTTKLKLHPDKSLISIIKIYSKDTELKKKIDFKIWENDYLIDPFEILELFSLSEAELIRVPKDRKVFHQQTRFEFRSNKLNIDKASKLSDLILRHSLTSEEDRTAMFAATKEGIDNAVLHGNNWNGKKRIDINFLVDRKKVTVIIEDDGNGFDFEAYLSRLNDQETFERAKKRILEEGRRGGLGILLMHRCTDRIDYSGSGNVLRLEKNRQ